MPHNVGYCCINLALQEQQGITTNRDMIQRTFEQRGIKYASELALQNAQDLLQILQWNADNGVSVFRVSSGIFPWNAKYKLYQLPDYFEIASVLRRAGYLAKTTGQRLTAHPDHFVKLASEKPHVVDNSIHDLEIHNEVFDLMGLPANHYYCLNIHIGQNAKDINQTADRFLQAFSRLSENTRKRLVVENDDKANAFSVRQLKNTLYANAGIPVTFDYFHHTFHQDGWDEETALREAAATWDVRPLFHYSESKNLNENVAGNPRAHADYVYNKINDYGLTLDIDLEAKMKEQALFKYRSLT